MVIVSAEDGVAGAGGEAGEVGTCSLNFFVVTGAWPVAVALCPPPPR